MRLEAITIQWKRNIWVWDIYQYDWLVLNSINVGVNIYDEVHKHKDPSNDVFKKSQKKTTMGLNLTSEFHNKVNPRLLSDVFFIAYLHTYQKLD